MENMRGMMEHKCKLQSQCVSSIPKQARFGSLLDGLILHLVHQSGQQRTNQQDKASPPLKLR
jgi:hypothetical protein